MAIFGRGRKREPCEAPPTTAELREARAREWEARFAGPSDEAAYRQAFLRYAALSWDLVQSSQRDLLRLVLGRVPAELGAPAIFALTVVFGDHPKAGDAARAVLAMIVSELSPAHARTLLVSLADAWANAERRPYERRGQLVAGEFDRALRRLELSAADESGVISSIGALIDQSDAEPDEGGGS